MEDGIEPVDMRRIRTHRLAERTHRVAVETFGRTVEPNASLRRFLDALPDQLAVRTMRGLADEIARARALERPVAFAMGAHVVKAGVAPIVVDWMRSGVVTSVAMNGAAAIHDWEIAAVGATSEDVAAGLEDGSFGMAEETGAALNEAAIEAAERGEGFGTALSRRVFDSGFPHGRGSILGAAWECRVPVTIHVAIGSDIVHQHPGADGAAIGAATHTDFRRLATIVSRLEGGVWINCGSAVHLPEIFLKALSVAANLGTRPLELATANLDMLRHYRTEQNVLRRPTAGKGRAYQLTGSHEINLPLLSAAISVARERYALDPVDDDGRGDG